MGEFTMGTRIDSLLYSLVSEPSSEPLSPSKEYRRFTITVPAPPLKLDIKGEDRKCVVPVCRNSRKNCKLQFFTIPRTNPELREKWEEVICVPGKLNFLPKRALICEIHFAANQISSSGGRKKTRSLVRKAIPSLFLPSKEMQMNASLGCQEEKSTDKDSS